jgi:hypothetical protein
MRHLLLVPTACICAFLAGCGLGDKKTYFTCAGEVITPGFEKTPVRAATLMMNTFNNIPTLLGTREKQGYMILNDDVVSGFRFSQFTNQVLLLSEDEGDPPATGSFDLVSRHLVTNSAKLHYDLICKDTQLAPV